MAMFSIIIPPRSRRCCEGDEEFCSGMEYFSSLEEGGEEGYLRRDYCVPCWDKLAEESDPSARIYWKSAVPVKKEDDGKSQRRDERALNLLKEVCQVDSDEARAQAFVLALLLTRNRVLQFRQEMPRDDGSVMLLYEVADTEEILGISKVDPSTIPADQVQQCIAEQLQ